jgi:hypothetical protein
LLKASSTYLSFSKSGTFDHPAVRIRVKAAILPPDATAAEPRCHGQPARDPTLLPAAPSVPAISAIRRAPSGPPKRVTFATAVDIAPEGRPQRLRCPPDRFSVSSLGSET